MSALPTVTVVVCAYNYERWVGEAIDSALAQDYPAELVEIVVVDDGSTDGTPEVLRGYGDRIRVIRQENAGLSAATETGIRAARGDLIALLDADDRWLPHKLRTQVELLRRSPDVGLVYSDKELIDADGRTFAPSFWRQTNLAPLRGRPIAPLLSGNFVPAPTIVFRRALADRVLPIPHEVPYQDWWLAVRIAQVADLDYVPVALVQYRVHGSNMAMALDEETRDRSIRASIGYRRFMLRTLDLTMLSPAELNEAWEGLLRTVAWFTHRTGTTIDAELPVSGAERALCARHAEEARAAAGDDFAAARAWLAARAANPFDRAARAGWEEAIGALLAAHEDGDPTVAEGTPAERLAWAEERYASGDVAAAVEALVALAEDVDPAEPGLAAHVQGDLAVIAFELGRLEDARHAARAALAHDPDHVAALETLGRCAGARGDHFQAAHWLRRAARQEPSDPSLWRALGAEEHEAARWPAAIDALERAAALAPLEPADEERLRSARHWARPTPSPAPGGRERRRLLICCDLFHPSIGGLEHLAEGTGEALRERGWQVEIACRALPERKSLVRKGMRLHEISGNTAQALRRLVRKGGFDAVLTWSDPMAWPVPATLMLPAGPRVVVVPCVTPRGDRWVRQTKVLREWREALERADVVVHNSERAFDARLNRDLGLETAVYVPQAVREVPPAGSIRERLGLSDELPLLLYIANMHPHKNHAGLLDELAGRPGEFQLVLAGFESPGAPEEAERVRSLAGRDPRVHLLPGLQPAEVAAALREADLFVNPSTAEAVPLIVQETMCAGTPWLATPECGAVHDWAGGVILPLEDFGPAIDHLLADPERLRALGEAGRAHWEACFHYDVAAECYDALLRGSATVPEFPAPADALELTDRVRAECYEALVGPREVVAA